MDLRDYNSGHLLLQCPEALILRNADFGLYAILDEQTNFFEI